MNSRKTKILLLIFLGSFFNDPLNSQKSKKEKVHQFDAYQEIKKCIFIENHLLPKKPNPTFSNKIIKLLVYGGIPVSCSCLINSLLYHYILKNQKFAHPKYLTAGIILLTTIPFYFLIKFLIKPKEITDLDNLTNFIKNWPQNKDLSPAKFLEKFESLYILYKKNNFLPISQLEAEKIVRKIIMDAIDYKIYLKYKECNI